MTQTIQKNASLLKNPLSQVKVLLFLPLIASVKTYLDNGCCLVLHSPQQGLFLHPQNFAG